MSSKRKFARSWRKVRNEWNGKSFLNRDFFLQRKVSSALKQHQSRTRREHSTITATVQDLKRPREAIPTKMSTTINEWPKLTTTVTPTSMKISIRTMELCNRRLIQSKLPASTSSRAWMIWNSAFASVTERSDSFLGELIVFSFCYLSRLPFNRFQRKGSQALHSNCHRSLWSQSSFRWTASCLCHHQTLNLVVSKAYHREHETKRQDNKNKKKFQQNYRKPWRRSMHLPVNETFFLKSVKSLIEIFLT